LASFNTASAAETVELGRTFAAGLKPGDVVALYGELGAGKTTVTKGIAAGLGVTEVVKSPSFVVATEYRGRMPVYHIDLYRLSQCSDFEAVGLDFYLSGSGVCLIEWAERAESQLPRRTIRIRLAVSGTGRVVEIETPAGTS
jgi:tRNA threonylcarbamoyladenosine biosynthesis protein TsaE